MALLHEEARQFVVARPAGFIDSGKSLVDEQNMHKEWTVDGGRRTVENGLSSVVYRRKCEFAGEFDILRRLYINCQRKRRGFLRVRGRDPAADGVGQSG